MFRPAQAETSDPYFEYGSESPDDEESATRRRVAWLAAKRRATQPRSPGLNRRGRTSWYAIAIGGLGADAQVGPGRGATTPALDDAAHAPAIVSARRRRREVDERHRGGERLAN